MVIILNMRKLVKRLTIARSLFKLRNTSCFLIDLGTAMSVGSSKACSMTLATYPAFPCWKSLMEVSLSIGAPSNTMEGIQARTSIWWSPLLSTIAPSLEDLVYVNLACLPPLCGSASLGGRFFLSSITSFPFWSHFLFFSAGSSWGT